MQLSANRVAKELSSFEDYGVDISFHESNILLHPMPSEEYMSDSEENSMTVQEHRRYILFRFNDIPFVILSTDCMCRRERERRRQFMRRKRNNNQELTSRTVI